jgi:hypothetical protein
MTGGANNIIASKVGANPRIVQQRLGGSLIFHLPWRHLNPCPTALTNARLVVTLTRYRQCRSPDLVHVSLSPVGLRPANELVVPSENAVGFPEGFVGSSEDEVSDHAECLGEQAPTL